MSQNFQTGGVSPINSGGDVSLNDCGLTVDLSVFSATGAVLLISNGSANPVNGMFNGLVEGANPVAGTFQGLPEGQDVANGAYRSISYVGGDGNDVVLVQNNFGPPGTIIMLR